MIHMSKEEHVANKLCRYTHSELHKNPCVFCLKRQVCFNGLLQSWAWGGVFDWTNWNKANVIDLYSTVFIYIYIPRTPMTSIFEGQPPKTRPFPIKTRVIWVLGIYIYTLWLQTVRLSFGFNEESLWIWGSCEKNGLFTAAHEMHIWPFSNGLVLWIGIQLCKYLRGKDALHNCSNLMTLVDIWTNYYDSLTENLGILTRFFLSKLPLFLDVFCSGPGSPAILYSDLA